MKTKKQQKIKQQILNTIPIFLAKTYKIVDNPEYNDIICWNQDGEGFVVKDINRLTTEIFPKHFKHSNFASFVRQLNMYGFHKIKSGQQGHSFTHEFFQKNQIQKLKDIKRKNNAINDFEQANESNMMVPLRRTQQVQVQAQLNIIKTKHQDLQQFVQMLVQQNKEILSQNRSFVNKMSKTQQKYRNKLQTLMLLLLFGKAKNSTGQPFILPQQFQNMLETFGQNQISLELNQQGNKKKPKRETPLKMLKNYSQADIRRKQDFSNQKQRDQLGNLLEELNGQNKQIINQLNDDSLGIIPPSPNNSFVSFPSIFQKEDRNEVSQFLDKLQHSDYQDLSGIDQK